MIAAPHVETALRAPEARDWETYAGFIGSDRARYADSPKSCPDAWRAFGHVIGHWVLRGYGMFVFTLKGEDAPLGMAGPYFPEGWPEREIGWALWSAAAEGRGYASEAARAARDHAFRFLGWPTAVSYIDRRNERSIALARRLGAVEDAGAARLDPGIMVYRHPAPEASA